MESVDVDLNMRPMGFPEHANMNSSQMFDNPHAQVSHFNVAAKQVWSFSNLTISFKDLQFT